MGNLFSASDIAKLKIPGLPTTRAAVNVMAKREGWTFEMTTGIGGTRRMYELPAQYLRYLAPAAAPVPGHHADDLAVPKLSPSVAGTVAGGSNRVDVRKLELAMHALNEWESTRGLVISAERRPAVIAILYDYLVKADEDGGDRTAEGLEVFFRALA